jgi:hypothetical protein
MSIYDSEWREMPPGYYADPRVKAAHERRRADERRFNRLVEIELGKMGYEIYEIPSDDDIETAENRARRKF